MGRLHQDPRQATGSPNGESIPPSGGTAKWLRGRRVWQVGDGVALAIALAALATSIIQGEPPPMSKPRLVAQGTRIRIGEGFALDHRIESSPVIEGELSPIIRVLGRIDYDVRRFAAVGARVAGRVLRIHRMIGADVHPGTVVADLESIEVGQAGRLVSSHADRGQVVSPSDTLFEIADLSTVRALLAVFERDLGRIREGDDVEILPASSERTLLQGRIAHVGHTIDPDTRSAEVRVEIDNRGGRLRPGQSVRARIHVSATTRTYTLARKDAITFVDGQPTVFALIGPGLIEPRRVDIGPEDEDYVVVRRGLHAGDDIVTRGLSALKSEIYR